VAVPTTLELLLEVGLLLLFVLVFNYCLSAEWI